MDIIPARVVAAEPLTLTTVPDAADEVTMRLGRWYALRQVALPLETQAEFARMAFEALIGNPGRASGELLDELVAELDDMLDDIVAEPHAPAPRVGDDAVPRDGVANWLHRLVSRRRRGADRR